MLDLLLPPYKKRYTMLTISTLRKEHFKIFVNMIHTSTTQCMYSAMHIFPTDSPTWPDLDLVSPLGCERKELTSALLSLLQFFTACCSPLDFLLKELISSSEHGTSHFLNLERKLAMLYLSHCCHPYKQEI